MRPKHDFLLRLAVRLESAECKAVSNPEDVKASIYAQSLRELHVSLSAYPEDHTFFQEWERHPWEPVALSDQASLEEVERGKSPKPTGEQPQQEPPAHRRARLKAAFMSSYCA